MYAEQLGWAVEEGVDFVISETNDYLGEALIAHEVIQELGRPAMVTLAPTQPDKTRDGHEYTEACVPDGHLGEGRCLPAHLDRMKDGGAVSGQRDWPPGPGRGFRRSPYRSPAGGRAGRR
jgi:hypothetical protein